jgi:hypothetical protein
MPLKPKRHEKVSARELFYVTRTPQADRQAVLVQPLEIGIMRWSRLDVYETERVSVV